MLNFLTYHYRLAPDGDQILNVVMRENIVVKVTLSVVKGGKTYLESQEILLVQFRRLIRPLNLGICLTEWIGSKVLLNDVWVVHHSS